MFGKNYKQSMKCGGIMIVYEATKSVFLEDVFQDKLVQHICDNFESKVGKINQSEVRSWDNLMQ